VYVIAKSRTTINYKPSKIDSEKEEVKGAPSFKLIFVSSAMPFWVILLVIILMLFYFSEISRDISTNLAAHKSALEILISKYPNQFTPQQVNSSKYGNISSEMSITAVTLLHKINDQLYITLIAILAIGNIWPYRHAEFLSDDYKKILKKPACVIRQQESVKAAATFSTSISGAVSVGLTVIGAVSLISPGIIGGYILAGLVTLLICVFTGLIVQAIHVQLITGTNTNTDTVTLDPTIAALWEGLISSQFVLLGIGITLIVLQVIFFLT